MIEHGPPSEPSIEELLASVHYLRQIENAFATIVDGGWVCLICFVLERHFLFLFVDAVIENYRRVLNVRATFVDAG